jgi:hypothetical protein
LIQQRKVVPCTTKNRLPDPSKISALELKGEFWRFGICSASRTIGINRSISRRSRDNGAISVPAENTVSGSWNGEPRYLKKRYFTRAAIAKMGTMTTLRQIGLSFPPSIGTD